MRTTINIDDDLLLAVKEIAKRQSQPVGAAVSTLLRRALASDDPYRIADAQSPPREAEFGFLPFPPRGGIVTNELIDRIREESDG